MSVIFCQLKFLSFVNCAESTALVNTDNIHVYIQGSTQSISRTPHPLSSFDLAAELQLSGLKKFGWELRSPSQLFKTGQLQFCSYLRHINNVSTFTVDFHILNHCRNARVKSRVFIKITRTIINIVNFDTYRVLFGLLTPRGYAT